MKLEIFKNKKQLYDWLDIAKYSNYPESEKENNIRISHSFLKEIKTSFYFTRKFHKSICINDGFSILLALINEKKEIIGTATIRKDYHKTCACQINNVAIKKGYRRQGLGQTLIHEIEKFVAEHSEYKLITLTTGCSRGFYENIGMTLAGILKFEDCERYFFYKNINRT